MNNFSYGAIMQSVDPKQLIALNMEKTKNWMEEGRVLELKSKDLRDYVSSRRKEDDEAVARERKEKAEADLQAMERQAKLKADEDERKARIQAEEEARHIHAENQKQEIEMKERIRKAEIEAKKEQDAADRLAQQNNLQAERDANERREQADREFQIEQMRLRAELPQAEGNVNNNARQARQDDHFKLKMPYLDDRDDVESFLLTFERQAKQYNWDRETWAVKLGSLLKGRSRVTYTRMSDEAAADYDQLKEALLQRKKITADSYRKKFRHTKKDSQDTYKEHVTKISIYLDRWIQMTGKGTCVADLKDLILQEQALEGLQPDLVTYIKDREPSTTTEIVDLCTKYEENRQPNRNPLSVRNQGQRNPMKKPQNNDEHKSEKPDSIGSPGRSSNHYDNKSDFKKHNQCFSCGSKQHYSNKCPQKNGSDKTGSKSEGSGAVADEPIEDSTCAAQELKSPGEKYEKLCSGCSKKSFTKVSQISVEGRVVDAFRDTGSTSTVVKSSLVPKEKINALRRETLLADKNQKKSLQTATIHVDTPYFIGETEVSMMENPLHPVLIGNKMGVGDTKIETPVYPVRETTFTEETAAVQTRGQEVREREAITTLPNFPPEDKLFSAIDLKREQKNDASLKRLHDLARDGVVTGSVSFINDKDVLYRKYTDRRGDNHRQVVVPKKMRPKVLKTAHDSPMAGHLGHKKTRERVWQDFFWPGIVGDIKRYCASCDACQRTSPKGRNRRVPMGKMPVIDTAFRRVAVDIVGPILPMSETKKQYILVMIDYATRYPEAVALKDIRTETVAEALWTFWTRLGLPDEVLTDCGKQFTSQTMKEVNNLLKIRGLTTTPWHPQTNGLVEKFNGTLKEMLKKLAMEKPKQWDKYIPALLFAYREVPQSSLGFSPFELLYGRTVKGPMQVLKQIWTEEESDEDLKTTAEHVVELRNRIEATCEIARSNLKKASLGQARRYNRRTKLRQFEVGTKVLLLLPTKSNKLELTWKGPYIVEEKVNDFDYRIKVGKHTKIYHINLLREYKEREDLLVPEGDINEEGDEHVAIVVEDIETKDAYNDGEYDTAHIVIPSTKQTETVKDIRFGPELNKKELRECEEIFNEFSDNLTDKPLQTNLEEFSMKLTEEKPVYIRPRPIPHSQVALMEKEVDDMIQLGVIEPAASPYNAPTVLVRKADGHSIRYCCDYRALNDVTEFDAEPMTDVEHLFSELTDAKYFSKLDLTKGYWAIPIREQDRDKTAFTTPKGQFRWVNMAFGLKNAGSVFNRMMRKLLNPLRRNDVYNFMDDILIATETWDQHLEALRAVLQRLKEANLAAKPSKCFIGFRELSYLGHNIGHGQRWPDDVNVKKVKDARPPETKKELRSYLGLCNFYRQYLPSYATIAFPLTEKTKKQEPDRIHWTPECQTAFQTLKQKLAEKPVIRMPNHDLPFVLRTDASDKGMGAVLLQDHGEGLQPIAFASKKFSETERRYATVEKECLGTVWGIRKFERYLYGKHFVLETDHQPLKYLQRMKPTNARLMRWALQLQPYVFTIRVIPGRDNIGADYMSRASYDPN